MRTFDDMLSRTTSKVLTDIFEDELSSTILQNIKERSVDGIIEFFSDTLPRTVGIGSMIIEDLVLETMYQNAGLEFKRMKSGTFGDYIVSLKDRLERS